MKAICKKSSHFPLQHNYLELLLLVPFPKVLHIKENNLLNEFPIVMNLMIMISIGY